MKKNIWFLVISIIVLIGLLSGCTEQDTTTNDAISDDITLESDVVEFAYAKLVPKTEGEKIISISVEYLFKNIMNRTINIDVTAKFYDEQDNLIYTSDTREIDNLPAGYVETNISPTNIITYSGQDANKIDYIKMIAVE